MLFRRVRGLARCCGMSAALPPGPFLVHDSSAGPVLGVSAGVSRIASYVIAWVGHLLCPAFLVIGVYLLSLMNPFAFLIGLVVLGLGWLVRPRAARLPGDVQVLTRADAPELYGLIDRIGEGVGAPRIDTVALGGMANAALATYGWRRRRLVVIGYPLWLVLSPRERVAVLAHELGHSSNGDARHGWCAACSRGVVRDDQVHLDVGRLVAGSGQ